MIDCISKSMLGNPCRCCERRSEGPTPVDGDRAPAKGPPDPETCSHRWSGSDGFRRCVDCGSEKLNPKHGVESAPNACNGPAFDCAHGRMTAHGEHCTQCATKMCPACTVGVKHDRCPAGVP